MGMARFFLHGDGVFDFRDAIKDHADIGQYELDLLAVPALYTHRQRVFTEAVQLHVLGVIPNAIPNATRRLQRMDAVADALRALPAWQDGRTAIFMIFSPGCLLPPIYGYRLMTVLSAQSGRVRLVHYDRMMGNVRFNQYYDQFLKQWTMSALFDLQRVITIPYVVRREVLRCSGVRKYGVRSGVMFHGDARRYDGGSRGFVRDVLAHTASSDFMSSHRIRHNVTALSAQYLVTARTMLSTSMCLAPRGDTPTSRRLFEALAAGCVPILVDNKFSTVTKLVQRNLLPFSRQIDWHALVYHLRPNHILLQHRLLPPGGEILKARIEEAAQIMSWLANATRLQDMRELARIVSCQFMDPFNNITGLLDAILSEATLSVHSQSTLSIVRT